jgi:hydroxymethylbilane synthase
VSDAEKQTVLIATRGSALALAQANFVLAECRRLVSGVAFELRIIKTTGDKLQSASLARIDSTLPRGLFTKELEEALLAGEADLAVHSLKDLPTELPAGLVLAGVAGVRADVRDVLIYRCESKVGRVFPKGTGLTDFPPKAAIATSSTRRKAQVLAVKSELDVVEIRGNVPTRLRKLAEQPQLDALILAAAGLQRLNIVVEPSGELRGPEIAAGLAATFLDLEQMLPCVGQGILGLEARANDERIQRIAAALGDADTLACALAERALLRAMGGGCQTPVGALASIEKGAMRLRAVSFVTREPRRESGTAPVAEAIALGERIGGLLR